MDELPQSPSQYVCLWYTTFIPCSHMAEYFQRIFLRFIKHTQGREATYKSLPDLRNQQTSYIYGLITLTLVSFCY